MEHASYCDETSFIDRFGYKLYSDFLSTSTKTLLNIYHQSDKVFYGGEMGTSALVELPGFKKGNVYFDADFEDFIQPEEGTECIYVNGVLCKNVLEMEAALSLVLYPFTSCTLIRAKIRERKTCNKL